MNEHWRIVVLGTAYVSLYLKKEVKKVKQIVKAPINFNASFNLALWEISDTFSANPIACDPFCPGRLSELFHEALDVTVSAMLNMRMLTKINPQMGYN